MARRRRSPRLPELTALRRAGRGRITLEVDGRPWRTVPDEVVLRSGLAAGIELDRPLLRRLREELLQAEALAIAGHALSRRDLSRERLRHRLRERGVAPAAERATLAALAEAGLVDDARLARARARVLAERGWGNEAIAARLEQEGIGRDEARAALAELPPESERAAELASAFADRRRAAALLARRGFAADSIEGAVGPLDAEP